MSASADNRRFWKVLVIGTEGPKPRRSWWTVIVEAPVSAAAREAAVKYVEAHAPVGPRWMEFHADWVASAQLPLMAAGEVEFVK